MAQPAAPKMANPGPLGLTGFALTTFVLSVANSNFFGSNLNLTAALPVALAFGGLAQLLAGMWEFHAGNTFGATAFTGYGAFWISFFFLLNNGYLDAKSANYIGSFGLATYALGWTVFTLVMFFGALRVNVTTASLFLLLLATFAVLTIGYFTTANGSDGSGLVHLGGLLGIITAANAFYNAAAGILKDLAGKNVLPV